MKRIFIVLAMIFLGATVVFANGETESKKNSAQVAAAEDANFNKEGYPIVNDKITINMAVVKTVNHDDFAKIPTVISYEEKSNIHINWEPIPQAALTEKVNLMFASKKLPDAFYGPVLSTDELIKYASQGVLYPLDDLIDEYAPNLKKILAEDPDLKRSITLPDGKIYSLPQYNWAPHGQVKSKIFINQEWLDKLGLEAPTNLDEFKEVLIAFRDQDPNGNGLKDEIPFTFSIGSDAGFEALRDLYAIMAPFGIWTDIQPENGKLFAGYADPRFKQGLKYYQDLYKEKLMDQEIFTQKNEQFVAKGSGKELRYGVFYNHMESLAVGMNADKYSGLAPLAGPTGERLHPVRMTESGINRFAISASNPYKKETIRWVDYLFSEQGFMEFSRGPEGVAWERKPDGTIELLPTPAGMVYAKFRQTQSCGAISPFYKPQKSNLQFAPNDARLNKLVEDLYLEYAPKEIPPNTLLFTSDEIKTVNYLKATIQPYVFEFIAKCITGIYDVDAEWDNYIKQLKNMQNDRLFEIYQAAYDRYLSN